MLPLDDGDLTEFDRFIRDFGRLNVTELSPAPRHKKKYNIEEPVKLLVISPAWFQNIPLGKPKKEGSGTIILKSREARARQHHIDRLFAQRRFVEALVYCDAEIAALGGLEAVKQRCGPELAALVDSKARCHVAMHQWRDAADAWNGLLQCSSPPKLETVRALAIAQWKAGRLDDAFKAFVQAISFDRFNPTTLFQFGNFLKDSGIEDLACVAFRQCADTCAFTLESPPIYSSDLYNSLKAEAEESLGSLTSDSERKKESIEYILERFESFRVHEEFLRNWCKFNVRASRHSTPLEALLEDSDDSMTNPLLL